MANIIHAISLRPKDLHLFAVRTGEPENKDEELTALPYVNCVSDPDPPSPRGCSSFVPVSPDIMLKSAEWVHGLWDSLGR